MGAGANTSAHCVWPGRDRALIVLNVVNYIALQKYALPVGYIVGPVTIVHVARPVHKLALSVLFSQVRRGSKQPSAQQQHQQSAGRGQVRGSRKQTSIRMHQTRRGYHAIVFPFALVPAARRILVRASSFPPAGEVRARVSPSPTGRKASRARATAAAAGAGRATLDVGGEARWSSSGTGTGGGGHALAHDEAAVKNVAVGVGVDALPMALAVAAVLPNVPTPVVVFEPP